MNRIKVVATIFCLSLAFLAFSPSVKADGWNKKTVVTFSQPVEIRVALFCRLAPMSSSCWTLYLIVTSFRFSTGSNTHLCDYPRDTELAFGCDRQNGNDIRGKGGRRPASHQVVVLSGR